MPQRKTNIMGISFQKGAGTFVNTMPQATPLKLRPEPENPVDPNAVAIYYISTKNFPDRKLGFLSRAIAPHFARLLNAGVEVKCRKFGIQNALILLEWEGPDVEKADAV